jgi:hypothetical protein
MRNPSASLKTASFLVGLLLGCSPSPSPDAGFDAGSPGPDGGGGGMRDSGVSSDDQCEFNSRPCDAGACTLTRLDDAGIAKRCIVGACDIVLQDCDAGFKCAYDDGGRACLPDGTLDEGSPCAGSAATCKAGLTCTFVGIDGGSACTRFCRLDTDCVAPQQCYETLQLDGTNEIPLVCADPPMVCDPLLQNCPGPGDGCYPGSGGPACFPSGSVPNGDNCTYSNDCLKGSACVGSAGSTTCHPLCGYPATSPRCDGGVACTRLSNSMTVGVCL